MAAYLARGVNDNLNSPRHSIQPPHTDTRPHSLESMTGRRGDPGPSFGQSNIDLVDSWTPTIPKKVLECSSATLENARYQLNGFSSSDHSNEDRYFVHEGDGFQTLGVFDGHDGVKAAGFASNFMMGLFQAQSWKTVVANPSKESLLSMVFKEFFTTTDKEFFRSIKKDIEMKEVFTARIPEGMTSYQAHQLYPLEVASLQEVEPRIVGGTTAVLAVLTDNRVYVSNVGDSRAILIRENPDSSLAVEQLSVDHGVENEEELSRLVELGLNRQDLKRAGRLGTQENTRSIGDYYIKRGYKNVDVLVSARSEPGTALPHIAHSRLVDDSCRYLVLFTDGVYKSIEGMAESGNSSDTSNQTLATMIKKEDTSEHSFVRIADTVLDRIARVHQDFYQAEARKDVRSRPAVNTRKRDDMTCIVYKFPRRPARPVTVRPLIHIHGPHPNSAPSSLHTM